MCSDIQFVERHEGESVVLPCVVVQRSPSPYGVYLKRSWLRPGEVLFMHTGSEFTVADDSDKGRVSVSGDPSSHCLNVTISQLRAIDTDRYHCEFMANRVPEDERRQGTTEFFLLVTAGELYFLFFSFLISPHVLFISFVRRLNSPKPPPTLPQNKVRTSTHVSTAG